MSFLAAWTSGNTLRNSQGDSFAFEMSSCLQLLQRSGAYSTHEKSAVRCAAEPATLQEPACNHWQALERL